MRDEDKTQDELIAELQALRARVAKRDTELSGLPERMAEHERDQEALRSSEEQYRSIFENAARLIASVDQHGIIVDCNQRVRDVLGYERAEMIGQSITKILDPEDLPKMLKSLAKILSEGSAHNEECRMVHRDGTRISVVVNFSAMKNPEGVYDRTIWLVEDITERKQAEAALRESEERYQRITGAITDYIYSVRVVDGRAVETTHGPGCLAVTGYRADEFAADPFMWFRMVVAEDRPQVEEQARRLLAGEDPPPIEHRIVHKNGTVRWVRNACVLHRDEHGAPVTYDGLIQDITDRKRAEAALRRSEADFRMAQRIAHIGNWSWDAKNDVTIWSEELYRISGLDPACHAPKYAEHASLFSPETFQEVNSCAQRALSEGIPYDLELITIRPSGEPRNIRLVGEPVRDKEGRIVGLFGVVFDITERKRAEEEKKELLDQLHQAQKMEAIGQLAAGVAHDFNNLLTIIFANADLIASEVPKHMLPNGSLEMIEQAAAQASGVTRALLTFSRKVPSEKKRIDLCHTIEKTTRLLSRMLPASIEIMVDIPCDSPIWVDADATQIQQVVMNLGINARDAMPNGGELRVSLSRHADTAGGVSAEGTQSDNTFVRLAISDTGVGMPPEILSRIFEPFFTTKTRGQGTGLGLSIIHGIVKGHAGTINVESVVGQGTTFSILLPCVEEAASPTGQDRPKSSPAGQGETIVLAEDNKYVSRIIATTLELLSYQVLQAETGPSLIECVEQHGDQIRLLIIDVDLPKRSGLDSLQHLRATGNQTPAIIITGEMDPDLEKQLDQGSVLLRKPFEMTALSHLVSRLCGSSRNSGEPA